MTEILEKIKKLGLNSYEAKVYLALLEREALTVSEISNISGVPRGRIYDTLDSLMIAGLTTLKPGTLKKYSAASPEVLQSLLEQRIKSQFEEQNERLSSAVLVLKKTYEIARENRLKNSSPLDYIEVLRNRIQIHHKYLELFSRAQHEVLSFTKPPFAFANDRQLDEQYKVQLDAVKKKVRIRTIVELPPKDKLEEFYSEIFAPENKIDAPLDQHEIRVFDELPVKMFVFDGKTCFFTLEDPIKGKTSLTMLVTDHVAMAKSFRFLFESFWEKSRHYLIINGEQRYIYSEEELKGRKSGKS